MPIRARDGVVNVEVASAIARDAVREFVAGAPDIAHLPMTELLRLLRAFCAGRCQRMRIIEEESSVAYVVVG